MPTIIAQSSYIERTEVAYETKIINRLIRRMLGGKKSRGPEKWLDIKGAANYTEE